MMSDLDDMQQAAKNALDQRRFERMKAGLQIKYRAVGPSEEATLVKQGGYGLPEAFHANTPEIKDFNKVVTEDLSVGGVKIATAAPLPVGTRLWLQMTVPEVPISINAMAEVRWSTKNGSLCTSGLKFESISKADLDKVERYLILQKRAEVQKKMV
jgi:PilZ domain